MPRWQRLREAQLSAHPLCAMCLEAEIVEEAKVCDHVEPHRGDETLFWSGPFQSLCEACHNGRKQREEHASMRKRININDINGLLD
jgi:5-methylcytosine-specific restriction protein A